MNEPVSPEDGLNLNQAESAESVAARYFTLRRDDSNAARAMLPLYVAQLRAIGVNNPEAILGQ